MTVIRRVIWSEGEADLEGGTEGETKRVEIEMDEETRSEMEREMEDIILQFHL